MSETNTQMKQGKRRCTPEKRRRLVAVLDRSERDVLRRSEGAVDARVNTTFV